ncbi:hypothetical protein P1J78_05555 [Psychromarinibacter sp. C21-152]|uniref:Permease n=1 Tax=Psychromarinibacter sediminicola TaxID=3033385 RepID=A0AAE3T8L9_9RHOB|nr:hypothetical protein [Psychromarinibacter sediminicola]MDF0600189.1 hypothetical protein [Psychromarinibacter sediminicola]
MIAAVVFIWLAVFVLAAFVWRREGRQGLVHAGDTALGTAKTLMLRLPFALLAASFLVQIVPVAVLSDLIGAESGVLGILLASGIGGLLPGGPMTSFPIAIVFMQGGAGLPQLVALIAGWSVFALHRLLAYEAPIMGWRFVALRMASCAALPLLAGLFAEVLVVLAGID